MNIVLILAFYWDHPSRKMKSPAPPASTAGFVIFSIYEAPYYSSNGWLDLLPIFLQGALTATKTTATLKAPGKL